MKQRFANNRGITLIALVITIIVLLILAGISISMLSGDNGILQKATDAKEQTGIGQEKEIVALAYNSALTKKVSNGDSTAIAAEDLNPELINQGASATDGGNSIKVTFDDSKRQYTINSDGVIEYAGIKSDSNQDEDPLQEVTDSTPAGTVVKTPINWTTLQGKSISDGNGTAIPLPTGFYYVGGDYNTGLVISDKENDTMNASGTSMGNQFVWIPVPNEATLTRTNFNNSGNASESLEEYYIEPYENGYEGEPSEYTTMKAQVLKYGGFYIGRFEAGINSITLRTFYTEDQTVVSKKGVAPYNYIDWGLSINNINSAIHYEYGEDWEDDYYILETHGAVYLSKNMYLSSISVVSTLVYGCQWDAMCKYIGDNNRTTTTKSNPEVTGNASSDVSKNIYDLAGNCAEWTMEEAFDTMRITRGGDYMNANPISTRMPGADGGDLQGNLHTCFRTAIYIK